MKKELKPNTEFKLIEFKNEVEGFNPFVPSIIDIIKVNKGSLSYFTQNATGSTNYYPLLDYNTPMRFDLQNALSHGLVTEDGCVFEFQILQNGKKLELVNTK